jgi:hypothetical protein
MSSFFLRVVVFAKPGAKVTPEYSPVMFPSADGITYVPAQPVQVVHSTPKPESNKLTFPLK